MTQQPVQTQPYYPPQYPQAPAQPQYAPPAPQQYAAPAQPYYPPAPAQQYAPPPTQAPLAQGSLDDFYNQQSTGGGASLKFEQIGARHIGIVTRPLGPGDVQQQTDTQGRPLTFKDGSPKWVMKVPLQMQPTPENPEGTGQWYVKGAGRDELNRAMAEAGRSGAPEAGAIIDVSFVATRSAGAGNNPAKLFRVVYTPPQGEQAQAPVAEAVSPVAAPAPAEQPVQYAQPVAPVATAPVAQAPVAQVPVVAPQPPAAMSPEQQALLAQLTGTPAV